MGKNLSDDIKYLVGIVGFTQVWITTNPYRYLHYPTS